MIRALPWQIFPWKLPLGGCSCIKWGSILTSIELLKSHRVGAISAFAIGYPGNPETLQRRSAIATGPRDAKPLDSLSWAGLGKTASFLQK